MQRAVDGLGGLDIIVNNAGRQQSIVSIADVTTEEFDATMKTNIYAPFWIIKAALPHLPAGSAIMYVHNMVSGHNNTVQTFQNYETTGKDPEVKAWAQKMLPTLKMHLEHIKGIGNQLK